MHASTVLATFLVATSAVVAQATCSSGAGAPTTLATRTPFQGSHLYGHPNFPQAPGPNYTGFNFLFDLTLNAQVDISRVDMFLYDSGGLVDPGGGQPLVTIPNQVGNQSVVEFLFIPLGPWQGNELNPGAWVSLGTGTMVIADQSSHSVCTFAPPIVVPAGTWAICLKVNSPTSGNTPGPLHPWVEANTASPPQFADAVWTITNLRFQRESWTQTLAPPSHWQQLEFHYTRSAGSANWTSFGSGCIMRGATFYERANSPLTYDLSNTSVRLQPQPNGSYLVQAGTATFTPPSPGAQIVTATPPPSASAPPWNDAISAPITLPWTFNYPTGSTNQIRIGSNGFVYLNGTATNDLAFAGSTIRLLDVAPRLCPAWADWDVSFAGSIAYDVDTVNNRVLVTWNGIEEYIRVRTPPVPTSTFQLVLHQNGNVDFVYQTVALAISGNDLLVGFSPGTREPDPGSRDLSVAMPFTTGDGVVPPRLELLSRPIVGQTTTLQTSNIQPGTLFDFWVFSFAAAPGGIDLTPLGLPTCNLYLQPAPVVLNATGVTAGVATVPLVIPSNPSYSGIVLFCQSATGTPGFNPGGFLVSNAVCIAIGTF